MRVVVGADEALPVARDVLETLRAIGAECTLVGPLAGMELEWAEIAGTAARRVADGQADWGVVLCWSGTGVAIAANKIPGVRAALCTDAATATLARKYNHANVLALSMRLTSAPVAAEIVRAFAAEPFGDEEFDIRNVEAVAALDGTADGTDRAHSA
jgi:ribose 5-phosphate isomerase B